MQPMHWRFLVLLLGLGALPWLLTLARGCDGGKPRPTERGPEQAAPHKPISRKRP
jgi:hypothetical protein